MKAHHSDHSLRQVVREWGILSDRGRVIQSGALRENMGDEMWRRKRKGIENSRNWLVGNNRSVEVGRCHGGG